MSETAKALTADGVKRLKEAGVPDADFDALQLMLHVTGRDHAAFLLHRDECLPPETAENYRALVARREAGEPLQYLIGKWWFYQSAFFVGPGVLIPRPETEELTDLCVQKLLKRGAQTVYDLCAGSGCIGISIALACPQTEVYLFERSADALVYLQKNIPAEAASRLHIVRHDVFTPCPPGLPAPDLIVSNPPYIPTGELAGLQREVRQEPAMALDGGADGLDFYRRLSSYWLGLLNKNGFAAFECGEGQAEAIAAMLPEGFSAQIVTDAFGTQRMVFAYRQI